MNGEQAFAGFAERQIEQRLRMLGWRGRAAGRHAQIGGEPGWSRVSEIGRD